MYTIIIYWIKVMRTYRTLRIVFEYGIVLNRRQGTPCPGTKASLSSLKETPLVGLIRRTSFVNAFSGMQVLLDLNLAINKKIFML